MEAYRLASNIELARYQARLRIILGPKSLGTTLFLLAMLLAQGESYYAVENLQTGQVVRRGVTGSSGIPANELILAPNTLFRFWLYDPERNMTGRILLGTPDAGQQFSLPEIKLEMARGRDVDRDGLDRNAEFVLGTNPNNPDTNGDGISDGAAIRTGLDPVTGLITGVIGGTVTTGSAVDVVARNDVAVVANGATGITIFNVFNQLAPLIIGQVDTPGNAQRVALSGDTVAVADGALGLALIDIREPASAAIVHQVNFGVSAAAVAASVGSAYVALADGQLVAVDLASGTVLHRLTLTEPAWDIAIGGDALYAIGSTKLFVVPLTPGEFEVTRTVASTQTGSGKKLFVGTQTIYAPYLTGYNLFDTTNPHEPVALPAIGGTPGLQFVVANGAGLALVGFGSPTPQAQSLNLYNVGSDGRQNTYLTSFTVPAYIQAAAIYNGQAYLAAGASGLLVLNYRSADTAQMPPTVQLVSSAFAAGVEAGQPVLVRAEVGDDVQVRNVEFYVNGTKVATDGNYPFEHRFRAPPISGSSTFSLQARVSDTGGNVTWSTMGTVALSPDLTPPQVLTSKPAAGGITVSPSTLTVFFSEPVQASSLTFSTLRLVQAGADGILGTADDVAITPFSLVFSSDGQTATLVLSSALLPGRHQLRVETGVTDLAGIPLASAYSCIFVVLGGVDADGDGVPNDVELLLGLNPNNTDSDADGIADGAEDPDGDQLGIAGELVVGTNPGLADSDGDGVLDGNEDPDMDGVNNRNEIQLGLNPLRDDTDGDGWYDEAELTAGSDPASAASRPSVVVVARPATRVLRPTTDLPAGLSYGTAVARPAARVLRPTTDLPAGLSYGAVVARPQAKILRPATTLPEAVPAGAVMALPPVKIDTRTP